MLSIIHKENIHKNVPIHLANQSENVSYIVTTSIYHMLGIICINLGCLGPRTSVSLLSSGYILMIKPPASSLNNTTLRQGIHKNNDLEIDYHS